MPKLLKSVNHSWNSEISLRLWISLVAFTAVFPGCAGRNIHHELQEDPQILTRNWTLPTHTSMLQAGDHGAEYSNPILVENTLIFGNRSVGLIALYPKFHEQRWVFPIRGGVVSELTVDHGSVYFGGGDGFVYSVNVETGKLNWKYDVRNPIVSRPTVSGGRFFITTTDDTLYALDAGTGKWLWHYRRRTAPSSTIYGASAPLVEENDVIAGLSDGFLVSLSIHEGKLNWERKLHQGTKFIDIDAHPVFDEGKLYVASYDGALYSLKYPQGQVLWKFDAGGSKQAVIEGEKLYLPSSDGMIYALQKDNAKVLWKFELDGGVPTQAILTDRYLIVGSSFQYLYVIDKNTGKGLYRFNAGYGSGFAGAPAYDHATQRIYILSGSGNLYSFSVQSGAPRS